MALGSTQPLTEMNTKRIYWGKMRPVRKADNLTAFQCRCHEIWEPLTSWNPLGHSGPVTGLIYFFYLFIYVSSLILIYFLLFSVPLLPGSLIFYFLTSFFVRFFCTPPFFISVSGSFKIQCLLPAPLGFSFRKTAFFSNNHIHQILYCPTDALNYINCMVIKNTSKI